MTAPYDPSTSAARAAKWQARRTYCYCEALDAARAALIPTWKPHRYVWAHEIPKGLERVHFPSCSYCDRVWDENIEDIRAHSRWVGDTRPGDHRSTPSSHGYCEHGMDSAHHLCNGEPTMEALVAAGEHLRDMKENR